MVRDNTIVWEPGGTEAETSAGTARRYRKPLKCFRWCDMKVLFSDTINEWYKHKAPRLGASVAFYTLLSLAPLLVVIVAVVCILGERMARRWRFLAWALPLMIAAPLGATTFGLLRPDSDEARVTIAATVSILALLLVGVYWGVLRMTTRLMAHARA